MIETTMSANNQETQNGRDPESGRFLAGNSGNGGRPKGSRSKLAEQFISDLHDEWQKSGASALKRVAQDDPVQFVRVVAGILPRELDATLSIDVDLFAECRDFAAAFRLARDHIGAELVDTTDELLIEAQADE